MKKFVGRTGFGGKNQGYFYEYVQFEVFVHCLLYTSDAADDAGQV